MMPKLVVLKKFLKEFFNSFSIKKSKKKKNCYQISLKI